MLYYVANKITLCIFYSFLGNYFISSTCTSQYKVQTVGFDMQSGADECKERGVEHDCAVAVERHVHRHQPLL